MSLYLDASAIVPLFIPEPRSQVMADALGDLNGLPCVSNFGAGEVASAISRQVRMKTQSKPNARLILPEFGWWSANAAELLDIGSQDLRGATTIVREFTLKLSFPDALRIAVCANHGLPLMTLDGTMADAAETLGGSVRRPE